MKTMKSISKVTMLFAFVAFANTLMASGNLKVNILPLTSETAVVAISNEIAANFHISIENQNGEVVYSKEIATGNKDFRKVFDFSNLEKGNYKLSASIEGSTTERSFRIENSTIAVGKEKNLVDPYFSFKNGVLKVSYLNFPEENLSLHLYNRKDLVYTKKIGNQFNVTEGLNLSKLEKGAYSVILSGENQSYTYNITIE